MTKYDDGDDDEDNDQNEDVNNDKNSAAGSVYDGLIFDPIMTPRSHLGLAEEHQATMAMALRPGSTMYLRVEL